MIAQKPRFQLKRVYEPAQADDGVRVLIDRLWPRGLTREAAHIDVWLKDIAPSAELRRWYGHDPSRFEAFSHRYKAELETLTQPVATLKQLAEKDPVTLLYGARDREHNQAVVLADWLSRVGGGVRTPR